MKQETSNSLAKRYTFIGVGIGILIWIAISIIDMLLTQSGISLSALKNIHIKSTAFFALYLLPLIFGIVGYKFGKSISKKNSSLTALLQGEKLRNESLIHIIGQLQKGDFNITTTSDKKDELIDSIHALRDALKASKDEELVRKAEDEQRHWVALGLAKFGEILRANKDSMTELSYNKISNLVKYTNTNQGGIYLLSDEDNMHTFEMKACYAYERRKFVDKLIKVGEGLVGSCAKEGKTVYLKNIPDSYLSITSGLGKANPKHLLLVPLKFNEEIHGVIEIASFNPLEKYVVDFIEKVAESIASTVSNVKINIRTTTLLQESREQAEMLSSQEEEMRQNMEELQATQEEAIRQTDKFTGYLNAVDNVLIRAEFDSFGNLIFANQHFLDVLEIPSFDDVFERAITSFIHQDDQVNFRANWAQVVAEKTSFDGDLKVISFTGKPMYIAGVLTRIDDKDGDLDRIMLLGLDATNSKKIQFEEKVLLSIFDNALLKAELTSTGDFITLNNSCKELLSINQEENHNINDFISDLEKGTFEKAWKRLINNGSFDGIINISISDNQQVVLEVNMVAIKNFNNDIVKIVMIAKDKSAIRVIEEKLESLKETSEILKNKLDRTDEELNKRVREVREELALQYKEVEKTRIRNDKTIENAPIAMVGFNSSGIVELFNKKASEIWGYQPNEILNKSIGTLFPKDSAQGDGVAAAICDIDRIKPLNQKEIATIAINGNEQQNVFITLSDSRVTKEHNYIAYIETSIN